MSAYKSEFLQVLANRGFIHQVSEPEALDELARTSRITGYIGFDCTAPSLHVGSLLQIMMLYWMQQTGHRPIALMGGGTTRVGDPSGKDQSRKLLTDATIAENLAGIQAIFAKFLTFGDGPHDAVMANNADWLNELNYVDFLRDVGRHFSVNRMLSFDSVKLRLERQQELSFLEFNYMVLQAYDFVELHERMGCVLQMGNIVNGIDLGRRMRNAQLFALTSPLITTSSGAKMGKTAEGAVWLSPGLVTPYDYWQYWRNTDDRDVVRFLKLFTTLPLEEIAKLALLKDKGIDEAKNILATEATALLHGRADATDAAGTARTTFEEGGLGETLLVGDVPATELDNGLGVLTAFVRAGLVASTSEARRQVKGGGLRVNDTPVTDEKMVLTRQNLTDGVIKLSLGRKRHVLLGRVSERQVADAVCKVLATQPNRTATIQTLVNEIPKYLNLSPADKVRSTTRPNEAVWEQQIRNIRSHHNSPSNFIYQGLLEGTEGGLHLTAAGLLRLKDEKLL
jgi:tyrosyl-tRNA synthetase